MYEPGMQELRARTGVVGVFLYFCSNALCRHFRRWEAVPLLREVSKSSLEPVEIPLPAVAEQKRIAARLDEHLAAVDRARAAALSQLEAVRALPAAYLHAAFNGPEMQKVAFETIRSGV